MEISYITGSTSFQSSLCIEELGEVISERLFGNIKFGGLEKRIYDEIPTIFISNLMGFDIFLTGFSGFGKKDRFILKVLPTRLSKHLSGKDCNMHSINSFLTSLVEYTFNDFDEIKML